MIKSMTGYGRAELLFETKRIVIEIKSVNHRYTDIAIKMPRVYSFLEDKMREEMKQYALRGKIDIFVTIDDFREDNKSIQVDLALAKEYQQAVNALSESLDVVNDMSAVKLASYPDVFKIERTEEDHDLIWAEVKETLSCAGEEFLTMRTREGARIQEALTQCAKQIQRILQHIEEAAPLAILQYQERLYEKIKELTQQQDIEESRVLTEVAIFADKICTDEEIVRLKSHLVEFEHLLSSTEPVGRKLDFLIQEMNREINTIGSKTNSLDVTRFVVDAKSEIEKLREQIQNIE